MQLPETLEARLRELIEAQLGAGISADISVLSFEVVEDRLELDIVVEIKDGEPEEIASRYFGLTGKVRDQLQDRWVDFFPVITPKFAHSGHA